MFVETSQCQSTTCMYSSSSSKTPRENYSYAQSAPHGPNENRSSRTFSKRTGVGVARKPSLFCRRQRFKARSMAKGYCCCLRNAQHSRRKHTWGLTSVAFLQVQLVHEQRGRTNASASTLRSADSQARTQIQPIMITPDGTEPRA